MRSGTAEPSRPCSRRSPARASASWATSMNHARRALRRRRAGRRRCPCAGHQILHGIRWRAHSPMPPSARARPSSRPPTGSITWNTTGKARSGAICSGPGARRQLIRYDERGNGLSDWEVGDISFDAFVRDLESVVEASGSRRSRCSASRRAARCRSPMPCAIRSGCSHMILYGGYAARLAQARRAGRPSSSPRPCSTLMRHGLGPAQPGLSPDLHVDVHTGRHAEQLQLVQRSAAHDHLAGKRRAHPRGAR